MFLQILIGSAMLVASVIIEIIFIEMAARRWQRYFAKRGNKPLSFSEFVITLSAVTIWLLLALAVIILIWTGLFHFIDVFKSFEQSLYFSMVAFTTLGFGDLILPEKWHLLSGFIAADGFVIFGLKTAILMDVMSRLRYHD